MMFSDTNVYQKVSTALRDRKACMKISVVRNPNETTNVLNSK